ncbi:hypothetical protein N9A08_13575 [Arthrobacter koreensis]|uniref:Uncharacterized protein n=1 Tax=Arthrobacter koreensis TaxID=199136 RepID=A0ABY6FR62_9MICC|nr:hypothetical protein [Arthrobacter koreensis]UYB35638.1 hypothetical protein N9A08_13575 [Arthrobacter koreensis]
MSTPNVPDPQDGGNAAHDDGPGPDPRPEPRYGQYGQASGQQGQQHTPPQPGQGQYGQSYGYQPAQPSGYSSPGAPQQQGQPKGPAPREVVLGFWLIIAAGVLSLINNLVTSFRLPDVLTASQMDALRDANVDVQDAGGFVVWFSVVLSIIGLGLYVLIAWFILKGHNWARILGTVFAAFSAVGLLVSLPVYVMSPLGWLSLLSSLAGIAGIVMLYLRPSNPYFRRREFNPYRAY